MMRDAFFASVFAAFAACSSTTNVTPPADAGASNSATTDAGLVDGGASEGTGGFAFGHTCTANDQCSSGNCFLFGDGTQVCTIPCASGDDCPNGAKGKKCNGKGVCSP